MPHRFRETRKPWPPSPSGSSPSDTRRLLTSELQGAVRASGRPQPKTSPYKKRKSTDNRLHPSSICWALSKHDAPAFRYSRKDRYRIGGEKYQMHQCHHSGLQKCSPDEHAMLLSLLCPAECAAVHSWEGHRVPGRSEVPTDTSTTLPHPHAVLPATQPPYLLYQQKLISVLLIKSGYPACLPPPGRALMLAASQDPGHTGSLAHPR